MRFLCIAASFLLLAGVVRSPAQVQLSGAIRGVVLDENHAPLAGAKVNAQLIGVPTAAAIKYVETDQSGHFVDDHLSWGRYVVSAQKEEALYPNSADPLYSNNILTVFVLSPETPSIEVEIHLGPKSALIEGSVSDAATDEPILAAATGLARVESPSLFLESSVQKEGRFRMLVPPATDVKFYIRANGYENWSYAEPLSDKNLLRMPSATRRQFDIRLKRVDPK